MAFGFWSEATPCRLRQGKTPDKNAVFIPECRNRRVWQYPASKADIQELTPELVREFIEKIVVHDRSEPWKKKNYTQQVDVYFNFVGKV
ncbi:MAG: DUF4368 domain-containing protein [Eubacteriales bacterium]|nr:DUF4368 domain-containing protein [Eubacteriales bacterium]